MQQERLGQRKIEKALENALSNWKSTPDEIDKCLKSTAKRALNGIDKKKYKSIMGNDAKLIITLGISGYGYGTHVFAEFGS
jgi:hypothetical protein